MAFKMKGYSPFTDHEEDHERPTANYASWTDLENDTAYQQAKNSKKYREWKYLDKTSDCPTCPKYTITRTETTGDPSTVRKTST